MIYYNYIVCSTDFALFGEIYLCVFFMFFALVAVFHQVFVPGSKTSKKVKAIAKKTGYYSKGNKIESVHRCVSTV